MKKEADVGEYLPALSCGTERARQLGQISPFRLIITPSEEQSSECIFTARLSAFIVLIRFLDGLAAYAVSSSLCSTRTQLSPMAYAAMATDCSTLSSISKMRCQQLHQQASHHWSIGSRSTKDTNQQLKWQIRFTTLKTDECPLAETCPVTSDGFGWMCCEKIYSTIKICFLYVNLPSKSHALWSMGIRRVLDWSSCVFKFKA